jgi:hypothetical protein
MILGAGSGKSNSHVATVLELKAWLLERRLERLERSFDSLELAVSRIPELRYVLFDEWPEEEGGGA